MQLLAPSPLYLPHYVEALERGWSFDNERGLAATREELDRIQQDPAAFLAMLDSRSGTAPPVTLPDGTQVPRLPGFRRWIWDGEFCGNISLRWQHGTTDLPPYCLGHIGYGVVPWKQRRGYASAALGLMLNEAREIGLLFVEITTDPDNLASQGVIRNNGGVLFERFTKPPQFGAKPCLRFRVALD